MSMHTNTNRKSEVSYHNIIEIGRRKKLRTMKDKYGFAFDVFEQKIITQSDYEDKPVTHKITFFMKHKEVKE